MTNGPSLKVLLQRAGALREAGAHAEAAQVYRAALALEPALPNSWYNLGWLERRLGNPDEALNAYDEALRRGVAGPEEVHLNRGVIFAEDMLRPDFALEAYNAALALNPHYAPALFNRGTLHEDLGQREGALADFAAVLAIEPEHWEALARLANAQTSFEARAPLIGALEGALQRNDVALAERASLGFALGRALDLAGAHDRAFAAYRTGNDAAKSAAGVRYDRAAHEAYIEALMAAFSTPVPSGAATAPTVLICGMFRSGSTLLEQALAGYPGVAAGGEIPTLPAIAAQLAPFPQTMRMIGEERLEALRDSYREEVRRLFPDTQIVTDKRPDNFLLIGLAKRLFPDVKILHTVRDPVDTCLSTWFLHLDPVMSHAHDLEDIAHWYRCYRRLMDHWKSLYPQDIHDFDYDQFVRAPRETLEPALHFLGLDWDEACLRFHERQSRVRTASVWQVREPLYARSSGRARHYASHLGALRTALRDYLPEND